MLKSVVRVVRSQKCSGRVNEAEWLNACGKRSPRLEKVLRRETTAAYPSETRPKRGRQL
jgi:hypothetical protein